MPLRRSSSSLGPMPRAARPPRNSTTSRCRPRSSPRSRRAGRTSRTIKASRSSRQPTNHEPTVPLPQVLGEGSFAACARHARPVDWALQRPCQESLFMEPARRQSVADVALEAGNVAVDASRAHALNGLRSWDNVYRWLTRLAAIAVLAILGGVIVSLIIGAMPALREFGFSFLTEQRWNPVTEKFGALAPVYGTVVTSFIAMLIAVPVGLMIAVFLTELCPMILRRPIGIAIELLAGIPSIIYGIWGLFVFAPFLQETLQPALITIFCNVPVLSALFEGPPYGIGVLTASLVLAIMVLPFITSISRDVFEAVPPVLKEAAYGIGCTTWEVVRYVVLPYARVGVIGGVMLSLGRALGETMAVTFVIGNAHKISASILAPGTTISATIANEFTEAVGDLYTSSLIALGLILFVITLIVLAAARYLLLRIERRIG